MQTVAVIFGGKSTEHDISVVTALASVIKPLELTKKYRVEAVYITKEGKWFWDDELKDIALFSSGKIKNFIEKNKSIDIKFNGGLTLSKQTRGITSRTVAKKIDIVFPAMHGTYGEDGALAGFLEMAGVPYVGCGLSASVIAMDKVLAKQIAEANNIPVSKYVEVAAYDFVNDNKRTISKIESQLNYPLFIKPAHLGSSIGISRAANKKELQNALEVAVHYDSKVIVEHEIKNLIEVTLPVLGNNKLTPALLERPLTTAEDFFDFDTKYMKGGKKSGVKTSGTKGAQGYSELPADLNKDLYSKAESVGLSVYKALGCTGIARVDMLIDSKTNKVYFNEVNPLPGDLYSHNWRASGMAPVDLVDSLVNLALERHRQSKNIETAFSTNYLQQF